MLLVIVEVLVLVMRVILVSVISAAAYSVTVVT